MTNQNTPAPVPAVESEADRLMAALLGATAEVEGLYDTVAADPAAIEALSYVHTTLSAALDFITERTERTERPTERA